MARYRKISTSIWNDAKFRALSDSAKLVFFMLLTHPNMTALGAMRATVAGLAEELGWTAEAFREAFQEAISKGMAEHDPKACFVALPNFLKYNGPESPNVVKAWVGALDLLPECSLKSLVIQRSKAFAEGLSEGFAQALPEAFSKGMPYPEPEPEPKQETNTGGASAPVRARQPKATKSAKPSKVPMPDNFAVSERVRNWAAGKGFDHLDEHLEAFRLQCQAKGYENVDWDAAFMKAVREDWAGLRFGGRLNGSGHAAAASLLSADEQLHPEATA